MLKTSSVFTALPVPVNKGGTGQSSLPFGYVLIGNGTAPVSSVAPGTSGNILTSDGTTWNSVTPTYGTGSVTSVATAGTVNGLTLTGGPITTTGTVTLGGTLDLSSPPAIGSTAANTGAFTTLSASSTVSGAGFSTYLASPPAIGGTTASTGRFTTITSTIATGTAPFTVASTTAVANLSIGGNAGTVTNGVYTTDTGTVTNTMLAGSITNAKLVNSSITFGSTAQALGSTVSGISGVTIDNGIIGGTTAAAGKFTTLESTGTASLATGSTTYVRAIGDASYPGIYATGGTNTPLVLQPLGTGALQAQKTDSTATGGNARGANAVDWQTIRDIAGKVASGAYASLGGGQQNTVSGVWGVVAGGRNNVAGTNDAVAVGGNGNTSGGGAPTSTTVVGGKSNTAAGYFNFIGGGFTNSGTSSTVVTTQSATMNGTTAVTLAATNANIKVGQYITGTSIAGDTYVAAISGTSLTLSQAASGSSTSTLSFYTPHGVVVGGGNNQATGSYSFIGGGGDAGTAANRNVASGDWSVVAGGKINVASGNASFIGGGGTDGVSAIQNTASGQASSIVGGIGNNASGSYSFTAGRRNSSDANGTVALGTYAATRSINGNIVLSACFQPVGLLGISQSAILVLARQTTDATATVLASDSSAASGTNQVILPNNSAYYFRGEVIAGVTGGGNTKGWYIEGVIKRGSGVGTTALVGTPTVTSLYADVGASTWTIGVTADTTNGGLAVTFTGQAATTIRCVARINTVEMTY